MTGVVPWPIERKTVRIRKILVLAFLCIPASASDRYRVRPGETLSQILRDRGQVPLYGPRGSIARALSVNPELVPLNGDLIRSGQEIRLPDLSRTASSALPQEEAAPSPPPELPAPVTPRGWSYGWTANAGYWRLSLNDSQGYRAELESEGTGGIEVRPERIGESFTLRTELAAQYLRIARAPSGTFSRVSFLLGRIGIAAVHRSILLGVASEMSPAVTRLSEGGYELNSVTWLQARVGYQWNKGTVGMPFRGEHEFVYGWPQTSLGVSFGSRYGIRSRVLLGNSNETSWGGFLDYVHLSTPQYSGAEWKGGVLCTW